MKTCKKCKKHVPDNMKICKYCGTDLSNFKKNTPKKEVKSEVVEILKKEEVIIQEPKTEYLFTQDYQDKIINNVEENNFRKVKVTDNKLKNFKIDLLKKRNEHKKQIEQRKKHIKEQLEIFFDNEYVLDGDIPNILFAENFKIQKKPNGKILKSQDLKLKLKDKLKEIKNKEYLKTKKSKSKLKNQQKVKIKSKIKNKKQQIEVPEKITKLQQIRRLKKKKNKRKAVAFILTLIIFCIVSYACYSFLFENHNYGTIIKEENRNKKYVFKLGDIITYKEITYSVLKVETSNGTKYKKPKEGYQYLIVTINFENNSDEKYRYSSEDWKMINSKKEETGRIITPVNAGKALYSGYLVVGGTKTASVVFEEPIDDKKLELRYYDPKEMKQYLEEKLKEEQELEQEQIREEAADDIIDVEETDIEKVDDKYPKPVFSIKINIE